MSVLVELLGQPFSLWLPPPYPPGSKESLGLDDE